MTEESIHNDRFNILNFAVTNSRSLAPKFNSMLDCFTELDLDFMTVAETWHKVGDKNIKRQYHDEGLGLISRPRSTRGGGVALIFRETRLHLKEAFAYSARFEAVCGVGRWLVANKKIVIISAYLPPRMDASAVKDFVEETRTRIEKMSIDLGDHIFVLAGDTNRKEISQAFIEFPRIRQIIRIATRGTATLDECYTTLEQTSVEAMSPLYDEGGTESDHAICHIQARLAKNHEFTKKEFWTTKYTLEGETAFGTKLANQDWSCLDGIDPNEAVAIFTDKLNGWHDECFPRKKHIVRSCDKPWVSNRIRRLIRRKKRAYRKGGKSQTYIRKAKVAEKEILINKIRFLDKVKDGIRKDGDVRGFYRAVKLLETEETPPRWNIKSLFPQKTDKEIAEVSAEFFNRISNEFVPVAPPLTDGSFINLAPSTNDIRLRILKMKKPKGRVPGDIDHRLLGKYAAMLAIPLAKIFRNVYRTLEWPRLWKRETVSLLPKGKSPASLSEIRNISCTPFFSKVLETFLLDGLKSTISLSTSQFGGKKGQGIDHLLIETWDEIHKGLERGATAVNLMAVDYQKAFNRLDHTKCLEALGELGGKKEYIALVNAFLCGRTMSIKIGEAYSDPRTVNGGAPQGSILGCFLFCATINKLFAVRPSELQDRSLPASESSSDSLTPPSPSESDNDSSEDEKIAFFRWFKPNRINDTLDSLDLDVRQRRTILELDEPDHGDPSLKGYIDDFNVIESLDERLKVTHHTTGRTKSKLEAAKSGQVFDELGQASGELGMKINPLKTQLLCISSAASTTTSSYIRHTGGKIESNDELKILGFWFDKNGTVKLHVTKMLDKARSRTWSLRKLRRSGLSQEDLIKVYTTYIRPILDYAAPSYHSQLTAELASEIERFQAYAMRVIFGPLVAYHTLIDNRKIELHEHRRKRLFEKFAQKAAANKNFATKWFEPNHDPEHNLRRQEKYRVPFARTERYRNSPLLAMTKYLNTLA